MGEVFTLWRRFYIVRESIVRESTRLAAILLFPSRPSATDTGCADVVTPLDPLPMPEDPSPGSTSDESKVVSLESHRNTSRRS